VLKQSVIQVSGRLSRSVFLFINFLSVSGENVTACDNPSRCEFFFCFFFLSESKWRGAG